MTAAQTMSLAARGFPYRWACGDEAGETGFHFNQGSTPLLGMGKLSFFAFCLGELIDQIPVEELGKTTLVLDQFDGAKTATQLLLRQLNATGRRDLVKKVIMARSESEGAVQVADMIAGLSSEE